MNEISNVFKFGDIIKKNGILEKDVKEEKYWQRQLSTLMIVIQYFKCG